MGIKIAAVVRSQATAAVSSPSPSPPHLSSDLNWFTCTTWSGRFRYPRCYKSRPWHRSPDRHAAFSGSRWHPLLSTLFIVVWKSIHRSFFITSSFFYHFQFDFFFFFFELKMYLWAFKSLDWNCYFHVNFYFQYYF